MLRNSLPSLGDVRLFVLVFLLGCPACVFVEAHAGLYKAAWDYEPEAGMTGYDAPGVKAGAGFGVSFGAYLDVPRDDELVRIAPEVDVESLYSSSERGGLRATPAGVGLRGDVTVYELRDYERLRAVVEITPLSGGTLYTPDGAEMRIQEVMGLFLGGSWMHGDRDASWTATFGLRSLKISKASVTADNVETVSGGLSFLGPEARISYSINLLQAFSDEPAERRRIVESLQPRFERDLTTDTDVLESIAHAAEQMECEVYFPSHRVVTKCPSFAVGVRQDDRHVTYLCMPHIDEQQCRAEVGQLVQRGREELSQGELLQRRWSKSVSAGVDVLTPFFDGAQRLGCDPQRGEQRVTASCSDGGVGIEQRGETLEYLCQPELSDDACKVVVQKIIDAARAAP